MRVQYPQCAYGQYCLLFIKFDLALCIHLSWRFILFFFFYKFVTLLPNLTFTKPQEGVPCSISDDFRIPAGNSYPWIYRLFTALWHSCLWFALLITSWQYEVFSFVIWISIDTCHTALPAYVCNKNLTLQWRIYHNDIMTNGIKYKCWIQIDKSQSMVIRCHKFKSRR